MNKETIGKINPVAEYVKKHKKDMDLTQKEFAVRSGSELRFVRNFKQGKETMHMGNVNAALEMFGAVAIPEKRSIKETFKKA